MVGKAVRVDGKQFACGDDRFHFRGVTYGTFRPRADGSRFPERDQMKRDLAEIADRGFTVVRTYTPPPDDLLELSDEHGLKVLAGVFYSDWRYLLGSSRRQARRVATEAEREVSAVARRLEGDPAVLAISVGNELPADVIRWFGTRRAERLIAELAATARDADSDRLVTYANYPTAEYMSLDSLDFLTFNVFLEEQLALRRYLTRLQNLAGDRPLVLGEFGLNSSGTEEGELIQAKTLDWQLETAVERGVAGTCLFSWTDEWWVGDSAVEGWYFGLTSADRSPKPALDVAEAWNHRTVADLGFKWPSMSVVICAYNAAATLDECLRHTCALEYPQLEIIVVDDGSTDDTAAIAGRHPRARLLTIPHGGLSTARNAGWVESRGELVVYLDSDAYPSPEWPWYLALGLDDQRAGGVGGPNVPPPDDSFGAKQVAQAPGGPVHVLLSDDRAEHIPGCNMGFWRDVLEEVGGFDPVYTAAGDDVDLCWRVLDREWDIAFHPAALVWHHRRGGLRPYLRQQRGYGRSEALVEAHHPDRFNGAGSARWSGRIYNPTLNRVIRPRIYRGLYGAAAYQSVYQAGGHALDLAHQIGVPLAIPLLVAAALTPISPVFGVLASAALLFVLTLGAIDFSRASPPRATRHIRFRAGVATMTLVQPVARMWGRVRSRRPASRSLPGTPRILPIVRRVPGGLEVVTDLARAEFAAEMVTSLRRSGVRVVPGNGWDDSDATVLLSSVVKGRLLSSAYPAGILQLAIRPRPRKTVLFTAILVLAVLSVLVPVVAAVGAAVLAFEAGRGIWRGRIVLLRAVGGGVS